MSKLLTAVVLILSSLAGFSAENDRFDLQLLSPNGKSAYIVLARTGVFGFGAPPSHDKSPKPVKSEFESASTIVAPPCEGDKALHRLMKDEFAVDALVRFVGEADLPGQLYALCGLHAKDMDLFREALRIQQERTRGVRSRVVIQSRGQSGDVDIKGVVKDIQAGRYDKDVTGRHDYEYMSEHAQVCCNDLRAAESFDMVETTTPKDTSKNQRALQALLKEEGALDILNNLFDRSNTTGKMFALCGLHAIDEGSFDKAVRRLKDNKDRVMVMSEHSAKETELPNLLEVIDSGRYDAFVR